MRTGGRISPITPTWAGGCRSVRESISRVNAVIRLQRSQTPAHTVAGISRPPMRAAQQPLHSSHAVPHRAHGGLNHGGNRARARCEGPISHKGNQIIRASIFTIRTCDQRRCARQMRGFEYNSTCAERSSRPSRTRTVTTLRGRRVQTEVELPHIIINYLESHQADVGPAAADQRKSDWQRVLTDHTFSRSAGHSTIGRAELFRRRRSLHLTSTALRLRAAATDSYVSCCFPPGANRKFSWGHAARQDLLCGRKTPT